MDLRRERSGGGVRRRREAAGKEEDETTTPIEKTLWIVLQFFETAVLNFKIRRGFSDRNKEVTRGVEGIDKRRLEQRFGLMEDKIK